MSTRGYQSRETWWQRPDLATAKLPGEGCALREEWYLFGRSFLVMESEDASFSQRFRSIFRELHCVPSANKGFPQVRFRLSSVRSEPNVVAVSLAPCPVDGASFVEQFFPERPYLECVASVPGWRLLAMAEAPDEPVFAFGPSTVLVSRSYPWQQMVAMYAISNAFRLQPDVLVFHAASVAVNGKGILLFGSKEAGKTTLSLCLASRGHAFLGDEWGAVSMSTGELLPLRRMTSIRPGPRAKGVDEYLQNHSCETEVLPDGTRRVRAKVGEIFPEAVARIVPLTHAFFLRPFASRPAVRRFTLDEEGFPPVAPLLATMWGHSPGQRMLDLLRTLGRASWWHLNVGGSPEETAELIEKTVTEDVWD